MNPARVKRDDMAALLERGHDIRRDPILDGNAGRDRLARVEGGWDVL